MWRFQRRNIFNIYEFPVHDYEEENRLVPSKSGFSRTELEPETFPNVRQGHRIIEVQENLSLAYNSYSD